MSARLVLGLGGTVDYEIRWDAAVISDLARHHGVRRAELAAPGPIDDERALIVAILALLERGVGGERFAASSDLLETFAARFETAVTLGGTGGARGNRAGQSRHPQHAAPREHRRQRATSHAPDRRLGVLGLRGHPRPAPDRAVPGGGGRRARRRRGRSARGESGDRRQRSTQPRDGDRCGTGRAPARRRRLPRVGIQHDAGCRASGPAPRRAGGRDESASGGGAGLLRGCRVLSPGIRRDRPRSPHLAHRCVRHERRRAAGVRRPDDRSVRSRGRRRRPGRGAPAHPGAGARRAYALLVDRGR